MFPTMTSGYYDDGEFNRLQPSIYDSFTLSPLTYRVILLLVVVFLLLNVSFFVSDDSDSDSDDEDSDEPSLLNGLFFLFPLFLVLAIRWISSVDDSTNLISRIVTYNPRGDEAYGRPREESGTPSPWVVGGFVVILFLLVSWKSTFKEMFS